MNYKNKLLALIAILSLSTNLVFADNKSDLLSEISKLETNLTTLKTNTSKDLEAKWLALSKSFDDSFSSLWIDSKTVDYLVALWKVTSNFKNDLTLELNTLNKEISDKTLTEINSLSSVKNNITLNYTTVTDNEKTTFLNSINTISWNYTNLSSSFSGKIIAFNNKYSTNLESYKNSLKSALASNTWSISSINTFSKKYEALFTLNETFNKNFTTFKNSYLAFAWDLSTFSSDRQKFYVEALKKELDKIRDLNLEANSQLQTYKSDIDRLSALLLENFANWLSKKIDESYWVIYSESDINSIVSRFNTAKNRYYDLDGKLKAQEVLNNTWALEEINYLTTKLTEINSNISTLIWSWSSDYNNTYSNVKIRLENEMVKYYNNNFEWYRQDLLLKLKEKLNIVSLEAKNTIISADTIDLRYSLLNDKISKSNDIAYINSQIKEFKKDVAKYGQLNSDVLNKKLSNLDANLWVFLVKKELWQFKYNKMSQTKYETKLTQVFTKLKEVKPDTYKAKLTALVTKVDSLLENQKLSDKTRFMLLCLKLNALNFLSK